MTDIDPVGILEHYEIGTAQEIRAAGGTAGRTWKVLARSGTYFLRLRGVRTSTEARLRFDHGLREHLAAGGVPTATAIRTRTGAQWVRERDRVCELYPFVEGRAFRSESETELANAARALARFHTVAASYSPPSAENEPVAQYTCLGFSDAVSARMEDPDLQLTNLQAVRELADDADQRTAVDWAIERVQRLSETYAGPAYEPLTGWIIHGDYTPANLLFSEDGLVRGIFDLDWAFPGARVRDVADGMYFFARRPRKIDTGNIWSLTDAAAFDAARCRAFLQAYNAETPLTAAEKTTIPAAFAGRWFSIRLEGMAKVPADERIRFFSRGIRKPIRWLDAHWHEVAG